MHLAIYKLLPSGFAFAKQRKPRGYPSKKMTFCSDPGKSSWPELVGTNGEVAAHVIEKENPKVSVRIVKEGMMVTMDFRCDRVRVWVDDYGIVKTTPHIG